jgi:hypothetical protein
MSADSTPGRYYSRGSPQLSFQFAATCIERRAVLPFKIGELLSITGPASEEMIALTRWHGRTLGTPLAQLRPCKVDSATKEAVEDRHYWVEMGHQY